jgi:hypothetical protein
VHAAGPWRSAPRHACLIGFAGDFVIFSWLLGQVREASCVCCARDAATSRSGRAGCSPDTRPVVFRLHGQLLLLRVRNFIIYIRRSPPERLSPRPRSLCRKYRFSENPIAGSNRNKKARQPTERHTLVYSKFYLTPIDKNDSLEGIQGTGCGRCWACAKVSALAGCLSNLCKATS